METTGDNSCVFLELLSQVLLASVKRTLDFSLGAGGNGLFMRMTTISILVNEQLGYQ